MANPPVGQPPGEGYSNGYDHYNNYAMPYRNPSSDSYQTQPAMPNVAPDDTTAPHTDDRAGRHREPTGAGPTAGTGRSRSRTNGNASTKSPSRSRVCVKCNQPLTGQFVRALGGTFHLECFKCRDCGNIVASKFFPVDDEDGMGQYPLCETDYFRRLGLLCHDCGGALRGSYITALDKKYHIEHFTCSVCPTVFGAQDSYYEHEGQVFCHYHYSTQFAQRCNGCRTAILKQFVEIFRNGQNQHWHPECYMIHKFWNVRLASNQDENAPFTYEADATEEQRLQVKVEEERMEEKVYSIWSILSGFEESSAGCISDMLLEVSNAAYIDGVIIAKKFIWHVDVLFGAIDGLSQFIASHGLKDLAYAREAKLLCKKIVAFFSLLSKTQEIGVKKLGVTQELLSLVTGLAHYLKLLIRIGLQGSLKAERESGDPTGLNNFLNALSGFGPEAEPPADSLDLAAGLQGLEHSKSDCCFSCHRPVDEECVVKDDKRWHTKIPHLFCSNCNTDLTPDIANVVFSESAQAAFCKPCAAKTGIQDATDGFVRWTKLQQFVFLLRVALARLLNVLRNSGSLPRTSDEPLLQGHDADQGVAVSSTGELQAPPQRMNTRSKSYAGTSSKEETVESSSLEQTVGEIQRYRSTRNERTLSTTFRKARTSRIIEGPRGSSTNPGTDGAAATEEKNNGFQIVEERDANGETVTELTFGNQDALTLDDIPRIVAAEQAKEQRPNAYKHARSNLVGSGNHPRLINGHMRAASAGAGDLLATDPATTLKPKKYFSELSALEYLIIRHVAVLTLEPLLEGHFSLNELVNLIEDKKTTFWDKVGKAFKNDPRKGGKKKGVFGTPLEILIDKDGAETSHGVGPGALRIPVLVDDSVSAMRQMDMSVEGVFRKNGNIRRLKDLAEQIDTKYESVDLSKESPVQVAALLKKFLRELPEPLLTNKLHRLFIISQKIGEAEKQRRILHLTCCLLPKHHRDTMEVLFAFLNWTASFAQIDEESGSKMDSHNLATVMAPNILYLNANNNKPQAGMDDSFLAIEAVTSLIEYNESMCQVPEDFLSCLGDTALFKDSEITTKELLKRYAHYGKMNGAQKTVAIESSTADHPESSTAGGTFRAKPPVAMRIDTDTSQANAWQKESSANPAQTSRDFHPPRSPFRERTHSQGSQGSFQQMQHRDQNPKRSGPVAAGP